ncbi:hypothetical protein HDU92_005742 [Lobulomyces angularis]|nr:hypothetical protein HDU92_005742 [Lobulomyces angularis]
MTKEELIEKNENEFNFDKNEVEEEKKKNEIELNWKNFRIRRIIKENHLKEITLVKFNLNVNINKDLDVSNLVATIGSNQLNVYDNEHCGDHLDIMSNFQLKPEETLKAMCWINIEEDCLMAVSSSNIIRLLSLARSMEVFTLNGHSGMILDLVTHPINPNLLVSLSVDGTIKIWYLPIANYICTINVKGTSACFNSSGDTIFCGNNQGEILKFKLPNFNFENIKLNNDEKIKIQTFSILKAGKKFHQNSKISKLNIIDDTFILSQSENGKILYWNFNTEEIIHSFIIKDGKNYGSCKFELSLDNKYFCVGNNYGGVFIYDLNKGTLLHELKHKRAQKPVKSVAFNKDCKNLIFTGEDGLIFRFDYIDEEKLKEFY